MQVGIGGALLKGGGRVVSCTRVHMPCNAARELLAGDGRWRVARLNQLFSKLPFFYACAAQRCTRWAPSARPFFLLRSYCALLQDSARMPIACMSCLRTFFRLEVLLSWLPRSSTNAFHPSFHARIDLAAFIHSEVV